MSAYDSIGVWLIWGWAFFTVAVFILVIWLQGRSS